MNPNNSGNQSQPLPTTLVVKIMEEPKDTPQPQSQQEMFSQGPPPTPPVSQILFPSQQLNFGSNRSNYKTDVDCVKWTRVPPVGKVRPYVPMPRHGHKAVAFKHYIIVFGGGNEGIFSETMVFDTNGREWFKPPVRGDIPEGRAAFGMVMHEQQHKILIFGGMLEYTHQTSDTYELDIAKWHWKKLLPASNPKDYYPCARMGHSFTLIGDVIYVFGGLRNISGEPQNYLPEYLNDLPTFYLSTNEPHGLWKDQKTFGVKPSPRESHSAVAYSSKDARYNKLIIFGGMNGFRLGGTFVLDVDTWMWSKMEDMPYSPIPRSLHSACLIGVRMYVFGGWVELGTVEETNLNNNLERLDRWGWRVSNDSACLNVETMTWEMVHYSNDEFPGGAFGLPRARAGHSATVLNNRIYIWSGRDGYNRRPFDAKDSGMLQVCCEDMWYLDVAKPAAPTKLRMLSWCPTKNVLRISWDPVPGAESYIVQCMKK